MKIRNISIFIIFYLITACSNQIKIKSATADRVIITGPEEQFVSAYHMAVKECQKHTKSAEYVSDETVSLNLLTFNCIAPEEESLEAESQTEEPVETEATTESEPELDIETEDITEKPASQ